MPNTGSNVVRDIIAQGVMLGSPKSWEKHNSLSTCLKEASEKSIIICTKNRCLWSGCLIKIELE